MNKKEMIRKTAITIFARKGFYKTTVSEIAKDANIAVGTIYNYFHTKDDILNYIFEVEINRRTQLFDKIKSFEGSIEDKFKLFIEKNIEYMIKNPNLSRILNHENTNSINIPQNKIKELSEMMPYKIKEILDHAISNDIIRPINTEVASNIIFYSLQNSLSSYLHTSQSTIETFKNDFIDIIFNGLKKKPLTD